MLIDIIVEDIYPPPTLTKVQQWVGRNFRRDFGVLCKIIVNRHKNYLVYRKLEREKYIYNKAYNAATELYNDGIYPSCEEIERKLGETALYKDAIFNKARNDFLKENNIEKRKNQYS